VVGANRQPLSISNAIINGSAPSLFCLSGVEGQALIEVLQYCSARTVLIGRKPLPKLPDAQIEPAFRDDAVKG